MKKTALLFLLILLLAACNTEEPPETSSEEEQNGVEIAKPLLQEEEQVGAILDWVDFIQWNGNHYVSLDSTVLADPHTIGKKVGEVEFNVEANVHTTSYKVKNGDAAFWEPGTELFAVKSMPDFLAVKDPSEIKGYRLYLTDPSSDAYPHHFKDLELDAVNKIEIYDPFLYDHNSRPELLNTIDDEQRVNEFISILTGEHSPQDPVLERNPPDPEIYAAVLYSDEKMARKFHIYREGKQWLWYPWDREFLPNNIESFIHL